MAEQEEIANSDAVVTMVDVLKEQEDFEENANAVLGASDDKNCTYQKGYVKRQALYACLTCCTDSNTDATKRAGLCLACSLTCHENHELVELYTKRNFRCDCGGPKFNSHPCQFAPLKRDLNNDNKYNQNFSGIYCICHRPYPDPEASTEEEMIQCIICEDWLHTGHLEASVPANDQYSEMICKLCMDSHCFLDDYIEHSINTGTEFLDNSELDVLNSSGVLTDKIDDSNKSELNDKKLVNENVNEQQLVMQNDNEQEMNKNSEAQEINKIQVNEKEKDTSSERLMDTVQVDDGKSGSKEDNSGDNEKDNSGETEEDISVNNEKGNSDEINPNVEADIQIKELENVNHNQIPSNNLGGVIPNTGTLSGEENKDFKEFNQTKDVISSISPDDSNPHTESDSQNKEFGKTTEDSNPITESNSQSMEIGTTTDDTNPNTESDTQNKEFEKTTVDSNPITESDSPNKEYEKNTVDFNTITESDSPNKEFEKTTVDSNPITESDSPNKEFGKTTVDSSSITENDSQSKEFGKTIDDTKPNTESDSQNKEFGKTTVDSTPISESDSQHKEFGKTTVDSNTVTESDSQNKEFGITTDDSNLIAKSDSQNKEFGKNIDDTNPNTESDSQNKEFGKTKQVDDNILNDKEMVTKPNMETTSQNKELGHSNVVSENDEIVSQTTAENKYTLDVGNSTPNETICEKVNSPMSTQNQGEHCPENEILQDKLLEIDTIDTKYDAALTSEHTVDVNTTGLPTSDEKDTGTLIEPEKILNEPNLTLSQHEDNGNTKKEINNIPSNNLIENNNFTDPVSAIPEHNKGKNAEEDNNDNIKKTEKIEGQEKVNSECMDTSNSNDLEITNEEKSNIDKLQITAVDIDKCDNIDKGLIAPGEEDKQDGMDIDEKEEMVSSAQKQDEHLLHVNEISPQIIQDNDNKEKFDEKASENVKSGMLEKQVDIEVSVSNEGNVKNVISDVTESLFKDNDQTENKMKDGECMVAESISVQECNKMRDENMTEGQEGKESGENAIAANNDIEMSVSETCDAKIVKKMTNNDERMNEDFSETVNTKTNSTSENDRSNENDIAKTEKLEESNINKKINSNTLDVRKAISEDVDMDDTLNVRKAISEAVGMDDVGSPACATRSESENLDNTEKSVEKHTEDQIQQRTLEASPTCDSQSFKRKQDSENFTEGKKIKIETDMDITDTSESIQCLRPQKPKNGHKGATFWPCNWRKKLCSCFNCVAMYRNNDVLFLIDMEDTVSAYEDLGKSNSNSQYVKGLEALSSLDRIQQINAITEYNKMKEKLLDFLKSFKDKREVVKEEDIKEFFAGMKPRREPDGVYFCR